MDSKKMIVKFLQGDPAGHVTQNPDGSLNVYGPSSDVAADLWNLVQRITASSPLTYLTGYEMVTPGGRRRVTEMRHCQRGDPDYLLALADTITRQRRTVLGRRVRAYTE